MRSSSRVAIVASLAIFVTYCSSRSAPIAGTEAFAPVVGDTSLSPP